MNARTLLTLGRTSNLPTVWSNVLCGAVLGNALFGPKQLLLLLCVGSLLYEGGMFLNDAFDAELDARERPGRPIPAGLVARGTVYGIGFALLALGLLLLAGGWLLGLTRSGAGALLAGAATALSILVYNRWHKGHAWSPLVMGACRAGLYITAALGVAPRLEQRLLLAALALLLYIVGLTHIARFETGKVLDRVWPSAFVLSPLALTAPTVFAEPSVVRLGCFVLVLGWSLRSLGFALRGGPGQIPRAVVSLIAGVSLVDALLIALAGFEIGVLLACGAFLLTLKWQRRIPGT